MENFQFFFDQKVTTWYRTDFSIEANSLEEAREKAKEFVKSDEVTMVGWEAVEDTIEIMFPDENDGHSTEELYDQENQLVYKNGK